jgi:hypothetical protein
MEQTLFGDPFCHIKSCLSPKCLYELSQTCSHYQHLGSKIEFETTLYKEINRRLKFIFNDQYEDFKMAMKESGAAISGSFILQCLLGETWNDSDIDIYLQKNEDTLPLSPYGYDISKIENILYSFMKLTEATNKHIYQTHIQSEIKFVRTYERDIMKLALPLINCRGIETRDAQYKCMKQIKSSHKRRIKIQVIHTTSQIKNMYNFIQSHSDFDICKNIYYFNGQDNALIYDLKSIFLKQFNFNYTFDILSSVERCNKYIKRGFSLQTLPSYSNFVSKYNLIDLRDSCVWIVPMKKLSDSTFSIKNFNGYRNWFVSPSFWHLMTETILLCHYI